MNDEAAERAAATYEREVAPRWTSLFASMIVDRLVRGPSRTHILEIKAHTGQLSLALSARLGVASRVIAVHPREEFLDFARRRALHALGQTLFLKAESADALTFGDGVFDAVVGNLALERSSRPHATLREVRRVLAEGGRAYLTHVGTGSWEEIFDVFDEVALRRDDRALAARTARARVRPNEAEWADVFDAAGLRLVEYTKNRFEVVVEGARELFADPFFQYVEAQSWGDLAGSREHLVEAQHTLDTYFGSGSIAVRVEAALSTLAPA